MSAFRRPGGLFLSPRGRIARSTFWASMLLLGAGFMTLFVLIERTGGRESTLLLYPPFYWSLLAVSIKRYHDLGRSGLWLLVFLVPLLGPAFVAFELALRGGAEVSNRFGEPPARGRLDYMTNP